MVEDGMNQCPLFPPHQLHLASSPTALHLPQTVNKAKLQAVRATIFTSVWSVHSARVTAIRQLRRNISKSANPTRQLGVFDLQWVGQKLRGFLQSLLLRMQRVTALDVASDRL